LTYDAIEPLRPFIEAKTFAFVAHHQFAASDFIRMKGSNELRIMDNLLATFTQETALSERAIQAPADFAVMLIQSPSHSIKDQRQRERPYSDIDWRHEKRRTSLPSTPPARPPTRSIAPVLERLCLNGRAKWIKSEAPVATDTRPKCDDVADRGLARSSWADSGRSAYTPWNSIACLGQKVLWRFVICQTHSNPRQPGMPNCSLSRR